MNVRTLAVIAAVAAAGCSGGGGGTGPTPTTAPTQAPPSATGASVTFTIPPKPSKALARTPNYVSPNSAVFKVTVNSVNSNQTLPPGIPGSVTVTLVTGNGGNCTTSSQGETCVVAIPAPPGTVNYTFALLDSSNNTLSTATKTYTVVPRTANHFSAVLSGVVASVTILVPSINIGIPSNQNLAITALDASGATIDATAPFAVPVVLTDTDTTGSTVLVIGGTSGTTVQLNSVGQLPVALKYNGSSSLGPFAINATVNGTPVGSSGTIIPLTQLIAFSNTFIDTNKQSDPNYQQPTLFFSTLGTQQQTTASESGYSGTFVATLDPTTCGSGSTAVATISTVDSKTFTVTSQNTGICKVTVADVITHTSVFWISVTTAQIGINARH